MPWYQAGVSFLKYNTSLCLISSEFQVAIWVGLNLATIAGYQFIVRTRNGSNCWHWQPDGHHLSPRPPIGWWGWFWSLIGWGGDTAPGHWAGYLTLGGEWRGWTLEYCQGGFEEDGSLGTNICSIITPGAGPVIITMMVTPPHHHNGQHVQNRGFMTKPWLNFNQIEIYYPRQSAPSQNWCEIQFGTDIVHRLFNWGGGLEPIKHPNCVLLVTRHFYKCFHSSPLVGQMYFTGSLVGQIPTYFTNDTWQYTEPNDLTEVLTFASLDFDLVSPIIVT